MINTPLAKSEEIGNPELFCGRKAELQMLLEWTDLIPKELAKSRALMATKKMGKTAILERLFNILFQQGMESQESSVVIPFFLRIQEKAISQKDFAELFYCTFMTQYLAFKCKSPKWVNKLFSLPKLNKIAQEQKMQAVVEELEEYEWIAREKSGNQIWNYASSAPHRLGSETGDYFLQILDEFQYLNQYIFTNEDLSKQIDMAGTYHQWAASKVAPLLISGSWVGWLRRILLFQLNSRFSETELTPFSDDEGLEAVYTYGKLYDVPLSEASALALQSLSGNHPFYISSLIMSQCPQKDLSTVEGVEVVLNHELNHKRGEIRRHWMEYIDYAFQKTNGKVAKAIVLFLSKDRHQEKTRTEILAYLKTRGIVLEDEELEKRLALLIRGDVISEGTTDFRFQGIPDDHFNQIFQIRYREEIEQVLSEETLEEIRQQYEIKKQSISPSLIQQNKGHFLEFMMIRFLKYRTLDKECPPLSQLIQNAPEGAAFFPFQTVGERHFNLAEGYHRQYDVFARAQKREHASILMECKYQEKPVGTAEIEKFINKVADFKKSMDEKQISLLIPIFYSISGFTKPALEKMNSHQIPWSTPDLWKVLQA